MRFVGYAKAFCGRCQKVTDFLVNFDDNNEPYAACQAEREDDDIPFGPEYCEWTITSPLGRAVAVERARVWRQAHHAVVRNPRFLPN